MNDDKFTQFVLTLCFVVGVMIGAVGMGVLTSVNYYNQAVSQSYFSHEGYYYTVTKAGTVQNEPPKKDIVK